MDAKAGHPELKEGVSDVLAVFAEFLRLNVAAGDASAQTVRNYAGQARTFFDD